MAGNYWLCAIKQYQCSAFFKKITMYNKITLIGNLGADPESKTTSAGTPVAKLNVATSESYKDKSGEWQTDTEWHTVIAWRSLAENVTRFSKGDTVLIEGKMSYRKWEDKEGKNHVSAEIVATFIRMVKKKEPSKSDAPDAKPDPASIIDDVLPF